MFIHVRESYKIPYRRDIIWFEAVESFKPDILNYVKNVLQEPFTHYGYRAAILTKCQDRFEYVVCVFYLMYIPANLFAVGV